jgi:hypothetical protein
MKNSRIDKMATSNYNNIFMFVMFVYMNINISTAGDGVDGAGTDREVGGHGGSKS